MKSEILQTLKLSRKTHLDWIVSASKLLKDIDESDARKPILCTQCRFGQWLYSKGSEINNLPGLRRVERYHEDFHQAYKALYFEKFNRRKSKISRRKFSKKFHEQIETIATLEDKFEILKLRYDVFYKEVEALEKIVFVMNEKLFDKNRMAYT